MFEEQREKCVAFLASPLGFVGIVLIAAGLAALVLLI